MDSQIEHIKTADMQENAHHQVLISFKLLHLIDIERVSRVFIDQSLVKQFWFNLDAKRSFIILFTFAL